MLGSQFKAILANPSIKLQYHNLCLLFSITQFKNVRNFHSRIAPNDSQILYCLSKHRLREARDLLDRMPQRGQHGCVNRWTSLLSRISKEGFIDEARLLFDIMPERNVVTYNAMLSGLVQNGRLGEAERFFETMPEKNVVSWTSMLCGLADGGKIREARRLFDEMPERNIVSWNAIIAGLIRNDDLEDAKRLFEMMPVTNSISWNTLIAGYAENCQMDEARFLFEKMGDERNVVSWTSMVAGYCRSGDVEEAYFLFERMPERNVVSWTAMLGGFAWNGYFEEALFLFLKMKMDNEIQPNEETFISLAYACAGVGYPLLGKQLHARLIVSGWESDDFDGRLSKSLIHMYSSFGTLDFANHIFLKNIEICSIQSWNSLINGYIRIGQLEKARSFFDMAHARDKISWTSMISGYLSHGQVSEACDLFNQMPDKDVVAWTAMISGHVDNELFSEAISLFSEMRAQGNFPLNSTYSVLLGAAGAMAYLDQGRQYHALLQKSNSGPDLILQNSLISMYAKCGKIEDASAIFSDMTCRDLVSWNSIIVGFSIHGMVNESLRVFMAMLKSGIRPNSITLLGILMACSHSGLVIQGWHLFNAMTSNFAIDPGPEHYICMIDLLGRAGKVEAAEDLVLKLPFKPDSAIWGALLGICGLKNNFKIAAHAAKQLLELDPLNGPAHVVLCNMYAAHGQHFDEKILRKEMGLKGIKKFPGCSWILLKGRVHMFLSGDKLPLEAEEVLSLLIEVVSDGIVLTHSGHELVMSI